jgi:hypothetical protein
MLASCPFKARCEVDVAWLFRADFKQYRQLYTFGNVLCFFFVAHYCVHFKWFKKRLFKFVKNYKQFKWSYAQDNRDLHESTRRRLNQNKEQRGF